MTRPPRFAVTSTFLLATVATATPADEGREIYEFVAAASVPLLPAPLRESFQQRLPVLQEVAAGARCADWTPGSGADCAAPHYIFLDAVAPEDVRRFPRDRSAAARGFRSQGVRAGGELPWSLLDRHAELIEAFRSGAWDRIVDRAGALLHFATDANLPLSTVLSADAVYEEDPPRSSGDREWLGRDDCSLRRRFQVQLPGRMTERIVYELRVYPGRYRDIDDVAGAVFEAVFNAHDRVNGITSADKSVLQSLEPTSAATSRARREAYYERMNERAGMILIGQLESAALLGSELIGSAWRGAGRPVLAEEPALSSGSLDEGRAADPPEDFVGSRNTGFYHRSDCPHVKRIKPANLVRFESAQAARRGGRQACRTCRPDESD